MLSQNGTRQPHDSNWSSGSHEIGRKTAVARISPAWVPLNVKLVKKARRSAGACSSVIELAPACSPEAEKPWQRRKNTSRMGARIPIWLYVGRQPTRKVEAPIRINVKTRTVFLPNLSPT